MNEITINLGWFGTALIVCAWALAVAITLLSCIGVFYYAATDDGKRTFTSLLSVLSMLAAVLVGVHLAGGFG